jgi:hypothetical protein
MYEYMTYVVCYGFQSGFHPDDGDAFTVGLCSVTCCVPDVPARCFDNEQSTDSAGVGTSLK